ncbi:protein TIC110, chloroplastic-like [Papaver somniferum]|nr:protein TIC110, chloroplastic-like [Papaver somniferum]
MFRVHTRKLVEENISVALDAIKSRAGPVMGATLVVEELEKILAFNNKPTLLSNHTEAARFALGVGPVSLLGGDYESDRKRNDLKLVYGSYVAESYLNGLMKESQLMSLNHLKNIFGLSKTEADSIKLEVTTEFYHLTLFQAVASGALDAADSKAAFLQNLREDLYFNPDKATEVHKEIYRQKLQQSVADGELEEAHVAALLRLRVLLCIPQKTVEEAHAEICGSLFKKVAKEASSASVDGDDLEDSVFDIDIAGGGVEDYMDDGIEEEEDHGYPDDSSDNDDGDDTSDDDSNDEDYSHGGDTEFPLVLHVDVGKGQVFEIRCPFCYQLKVNVNPFAKVDGIFPIDYGDILVRCCNKFGVEFHFRDGGCSRSVVDRRDRRIHFDVKYRLNTLNAFSMTCPLCETVHRPQTLHDELVTVKVSCCRASFTLTDTDQLQTSDSAR